MKRITLPVREETASVLEGWQALRELRAHALAARAGAEFWLYDAEDVAGAVRYDKRQTLQQVRRRKIRVFERDEHPSESVLQQFFDANEHEMVVMSPADRVSAGGVLTLFARPNSPIVGVDAKGYHCPRDPSEVSTKKLFCQPHQVDYVDDA